jgi:hypothetical protein
VSSNSISKKERDRRLEKMKNEQYQASRRPLRENEGKEARSVN